MEPNNFEQRYNFRPLRPVNYVEQEDESSHSRHSRRNGTEQKHGLNLGSQIHSENRHNQNPFSQNFENIVRQQVGVQQNVEEQMQLAVFRPPNQNDAQSFGNPRAHSTPQNVSPHISYNGQQENFEQNQNWNPDANRFGNHRRQNPRIFVNSQMANNLNFSARNSQNFVPNREIRAQPVRNAHNPGYEEVIGEQNCNIPNPDYGREIGMNYPIQNARNFVNGPNFPNYDPVRNINQPNYQQQPNPNFGNVAPQPNQFQPFLHDQKPYVQNFQFVPPQNFQQNQIPDIVMELHKVTLSNQYANTLREIPNLYGTEGRDKIKDFFLNVQMCAGDWRPEKQKELLQTKLKGKALKAYHIALNKFGNEANFGVFKNRNYANFERNGLQRGQCFFGIDTEWQKEAERGNCQIRLDEYQLDEVAKKHFISNVNDVNLARFLECQTKPNQTFDELLMMANRLSLIDDGKNRERNESVGIPVQFQQPGPQLNRTVQFQNPNYGQGFERNFPNFGMRAQNISRQIGRVASKMNDSNRKTEIISPIRILIIFKTKILSLIKNISPKTQINVYRTNKMTFKTLIVTKEIRISYQISVLSIFKTQNYDQQQGANDQKIETISANGIQFDSHQQSNPMTMQNMELNMIKVKEKEVENAEKKLVKISHIEHKEPPAYEKFFDSLIAHSTEFPSPNPTHISNSECIVIELNVAGVKATALTDSAAETNVANPEFLHKIAREKGVNLIDWGFSPNKGKSQIPFKVESFTGGKVPMVGVLNVPMEKGNWQGKINCVVTKKPFPYDLILGQNALSALGYYIGNVMTNEIINFGDRPRNLSNSVESPP